jgi:arylsulfatase
MQIDSYTGELLDTIDDLGITENTIFIFTADNGPEALDFGETTMTVETAVYGSAGPWRASLFTSFEGALRVPFVIRWPGKIAAGGVSDEIVHEMDLFPTLAIVHEMDLFPTLARIAGGKVPQDRVIDGIEMTDFLMGKTEKSGREGFIVYMGKDIFGVKWRNWKLHFKEQDSWNGKLREYTMPRQRPLSAHLGDKSRSAAAVRACRLAKEKSANTERRQGSLQAAKMTETHLQLYVNYNSFQRAG